MAQAASFPPGSPEYYFKGDPALTTDQDGEEGRVYVGQDLLSLFGLRNRQNELRQSPTSTGTYLSYIQDLPGKNECVNGASLFTAITEPDIHTETIKPLDNAQVKAAFYLRRNGPLAGFDASVFGMDESDDDDKDERTTSQPTTPLIPQENTGSPKLKIKIKLSSEDASKKRKSNQPSSQKTKKR